MEKDHILEVKSVTKKFNYTSTSTSLKSMFTSLFRPSGTAKDRNFNVLKEISFDVRPGEFFGVVGKNGSGKSTLLKIIAGIYQPSSGSVRLDGRLVPFIELGVGFNPELTGRENVYLNGALLGFSKKEIDVRYNDIVSFAELEKFMDQKLKNYSSGMQVRLAFSVAIRADADILLIDEVLAVGDAAFQKKCFDYFFELKTQGKTVVFISHDMDAVKTYCDRAMVLDGGKIIHLGSVEEAAEKYIALFDNGSAPTAKREWGDTKRWGNGVAKIVHAEAVTERQNTRLNVVVDVIEDVRLLSVGFAVKERGSQEVIFGSNTEHMGQRLKNLNKGERIGITWTIPSVLRNGHYAVDIAAHGRAGLPVYDWMHDALEISITKGLDSPYVLAPQVVVDIKRI